MLLYQIYAKIQWKEKTTSLVEGLDFFMDNSKV